jgi:YD repeat-containing protein
MQYDGAGRLTSVCEILSSGGSSCGQNTTASGYLTTYTYGVPSGGVSQFTVTQGVQTRTYISDGLGRLISETNPESGTTSYVYDVRAISQTCAVCSTFFDQGAFWGEHGQEELSFQHLTDRSDQKDRPDSSTYN